jgi:hypothetical protein
VEKTREGVQRDTGTVDKKAFCTKKSKYVEINERRSMGNLQFTDKKNDVHLIKKTD